MISVGPEDIHRLMMEVNETDELSLADFSVRSGVSLEAIKLLGDKCVVLISQMLRDGNQEADVLYNVLGKAFALGWRAHEQYGRVNEDQPV